ncbi:MAG: CbtA family protein, partial [Haloechinothrix sp.]
MMRTLLVRGLIAGLIAGIAAAIFAYFVGEPQVDAAIAIEEAGAAEHAAAGHDDGEEAIVSRGVQSTIGLLVAQTGFGIAIGGLFSLAFAFLYGRLGAFSPRAYAAALAAGAFVVIGLVPFVKYPANPPAVGQPGTIASRTELHFGFLAIALLAAGVAVYAAKVLAERHGGWSATIAAGAGYLVVMTACGVLLPVVDEVPADFPATVLWDFRVASLGNLLVLWAVLGLVFGSLAQRTLSHATT